MSETFIEIDWLQHLEISRQTQPTIRPKPVKTERVKTLMRVSKGIFGIRDLTKVRCGNRENDKYIYGIRDLTVPGKRDSPKIGYGMRDLCLHVCRECRKPSRPTGSSGQSESTRRAQNKEEKCKNWNNYNGYSTRCYENKNIYTHI